MSTQQGEMPFEPDAFRAEVREFCRRELPPELAAKARVHVYFSREDRVRWQRILQRRGWFAGHWPREYAARAGGRGSASSSLRSSSTPARRGSRTSASRSPGQSSTRTEATRRRRAFCPESCNRTAGGARASRTGRRFGPRGRARARHSAGRPLHRVRPQEPGQRWLSGPT